MEICNPGFGLTKNAYPHIEIIPPKVNMPASTKQPATKASPSLGKPRKPKASLKKKGTGASKRSVTITHKIPLHLLLKRISKKVLFKHLETKKKRTTVPKKKKTKNQKKTTP